MKSILVLKNGQNKCPKIDFKNTLTEKKFCLDNENLSSQIKRYILNFVM
jgi:hypothetical protein